VKTKETVKGMTLARHGRVVVAALACGWLGIGCESTPSTPLVGEIWTVRPTATHGIDSLDGPVDADVPPVPELPLCTLAGPPAPSSGEVLVFSDEFDGEEVDESKWTLYDGDRGHGGVSNVAQRENVRVHDGLLHVETTRTAEGAALPYASGYLETLGKFARTYGKIEIRARFPYAAGVWFAIWGRPWWEAFPELDIELVNRPTVGHSQLYFVNHWAAPPLPADQRRRFVMMENEIDYSDFHTYTLVWRPDLMEWSVDGVPKFEITPFTNGLPSLPVYWIVNGWVGGWAGNPDATTPFPNSFEVDYLRVYRLDGLIAPPEIKVVSPKQEYVRGSTIRVVTANFDEACSHVEMYDGERLVKTAAGSQVAFSTNSLTPGKHRITFVATDGERRVLAILDPEIR
jgi:beta-glucanase (GH16 family)